MESLIGSGQLTGLLGVLTGVFAVLMPVAIVFLVLHYRQRRASELLATVRLLAEKGLPVPAELLRQDGGRRADPRSLLLNALSTLGAGIGLIIFFYAFTPVRFLWGTGAILAFVGVAQLGGLWLTRKQPRDDASAGAG
jgi:hypothetical protein